MNTVTQEQYEYELQGLAEEPNAEDHIIIDAEVRKTSKYDIKLTNTTDTAIDYKVETDLYNATGLEKFSIPAKKSFNYLLCITPTVSGQQTG